MWIKRKERCLWTLETVYQLMEMETETQRSWILYFWLCLRTQIQRLTVLMISYGWVILNTGHQTGIPTLPESRFSHHMALFHQMIWTQLTKNHWLSLRYYSMYMIIHVTDKNGKHRFGLFFVFKSSIKLFRNQC